MGNEHQADGVFARLVDGQVVSAEVVPCGGERCHMLVLSLADGYAGDALDSVAAGRDEGSDDARLGLQHLDDLLDLPADVVGSVEV